ncbi:response regulator [Streptomyces radicis]|uniref:histidine kinase n=1 Tax=Streptomyces radicis TaxID=1750517 RepID=A0A3A9VT45_9ACTN|nr:response regulator [Streptomyces radicis]RKN13631.1 response regulator [Streptomyces radicis]
MGSPTDDDRNPGRSARLSRGSYALTLLTASVVWAPDDSRVQPEQVGLVGFVLLASAVADSTRSRRDYVAAVEARAELAELTREDEARHRVGAERMRIARELHDVVAHHIALAHAQAATADHLLSAKPDQARDALRHLTPTLLSALNELRATVGLLRQTGHEDPLGPAPGLAHLPDLLDTFEHAGLTVRLTCDGTPKPPSPSVDLTAYRIIQEALTNVTKHARTPTAFLHLSCTGRLLTITVCDTGPRRTAANAIPGYGLIGMRERVQAVGGRLRARPKDDRGFEVIAELPADSPHPHRPPARRPRGSPVTIRVLLADDQALLAGTFKILIDAADDMEVVGLAEDGARTVDLTRATTPDVVVMDIRMPGKDGLTAAEEITQGETLGKVRILVLTTFETDEYVTQALRAGATGFLGKGATPTELLSATRAVVTRYLAIPGPSTAVPRALETLTSREREVLAQAARGLTNVEIAQLLHLSPLTVRTFIQRIMTKLEARHRAQLVAIAYQTGFVRAHRPPAT